jgi:hypothetical protein
MTNQHGPYHRLGGPGGPGCRVASIPVTGKNLDGSTMEGRLLDAGTEATELELLRTVANELGVRWGHDNLGWWAAVPAKK